MADAFTAGGYLVRLAVHDARTLKDKRRVIKSLIDRLRNQSILGVSETGALDRINAAEIGIVGCSNDGHHLQSMLDSALNVALDDPRVELVSQTQITLTPIDEAGTLEGWMSRLQSKTGNPEAEDDDADVEGNGGKDTSAESARRRPARDD